MTKIKRCISVIILAAFTVMLLTGCKMTDDGIYAEPGDVTDISQRTKSSYNLEYLSIMQDGSMTSKLYKLAQYYAVMDEGDKDAMNDSGATQYYYTGGLTSGSYYYIGNSMVDTGQLLTSLNNMVKYYDNREISFRLYKATSGGILLGAKELYILGFTITIYNTDDDSSNNTDDNADDPTSSGCGSDCNCCGDCSCEECTCESVDEYEPCICS